MKLYATVTIDGKVHKVRQILLREDGKVFAITTAPEIPWGPFYELTEQEIEKANLYLRVLGEKPK
jgi:hypothetical protein